MLHFIFKIDKICWNGFQEEPVLKLTGREAVEYFAKCHHIGKIQSIYFNIAETRHFRPYDLISVHKNKVRYLIAKWYEYLLILCWKLGFILFRLMVRLEYRKIIACRLWKLKKMIFFITISFFNLSLTWRFNKCVFDIQYWNCFVNDLPKACNTLY